MSKKVVHQVSLTGIGGVQQSFLPYFHKAIDESKFSHVIYGMHDIEEYYQSVSPYYQNINSSVISKIKFLYHLKSTNSIVHFYNNLGSQKVSGLLKKIRPNNVIFHERGTAWNASESCAKYFSLNNSFASKVLANSEASKIMLKERFGINEVEVIHNGFFSNQHEFSNLRKSQRSNIIGYIGRLDTPKGVHVLIDAAAKMPEYEFRIAGDGILKDSLLNKAKNLSNVEFVGRISEPEKFISQLDLLVVPSIREPLGNIVIEAGYCNVPVLASCVDGIAEIITDDYSGYLLKPSAQVEVEDVPSGAIPLPEYVVDPLSRKLVRPMQLNIDELISKIQDIFANYDHAVVCAKNLNKVVKEKFSVETYYNSIEKIYGEL